MHRGIEILILCAGVLLGGLAGWIFLGRGVFCFFDRFFLVVIEELPVVPMEVREREFAIGRQIWPFPREGDEAVVRFELKVDETKRLRLWKHGSGFFWFGPVIGVRVEKDGSRREFLLEPDAGDRVSLTQSYSRLSWPTPFEINFLGGPVSRWRRHMYDRLVWEKSSGQTLEIVWRHQQWFSKRGEWSDQWDVRLVAVRVSADPLTAVVNRYCRETKRWDASGYRLERRTPEEGMEVVAVIHRDDEKSPSPGAGRSVVLVIDPVAGKVVKEIGGQ